MSVSMKMESRPERLQGTDGIRGPVSQACLFPKKHPLAVWIDEEVLTEEFFELYAYSFCSYLLDEGWARTGDCLVLGWDTRDMEGIYNSAAVDGVRKAGLTAVVVGVMPTPAVALYQLSRGAAGALVLTASHNPAEQNGIKIFLGHTGLKLFPEDDRRLTEICFSLDQDTLKKADLKGSKLHEEERAIEFLLSLTQDPFNSWLDEGTLAGVTLVVDAANGAFSLLLERLGSEFGGARLILCNNKPERGINLDCGVADLEGLGFLDPLMLEEEPFCRAEALQTLLRKGRQQRERLLSGRDLVMGLVLDGDGDRCFLLTYDPLADRILVINGDGLAIIQAMWLKKIGLSQNQPLLINTVESDLESGRSAAENGYIVNQCTVGDKWILRHEVIIQK